jgi:hypothetical protein
MLWMKTNKRLTVIFFILAALAAGPLLFTPERNLGYYARNELSRMGERHIASANRFDINEWRPLYEIIDPDNFLGLIHYQTFVEEKDNKWREIMAGLSQRINSELKSTNHYTEEILFQMITEPSISKKYLRIFTEEFKKHSTSSSLYILPSVQQSSSEELIKEIRERKDHYLPIDQDKLIRSLDGILSLKIPPNKKDYQYLAGSIHLNFDEKNQQLNVSLYRYFKLNNSSVFKIKSKTEHSEIKFLHYKKEKLIETLPVTVRTTYQFQLKDDVQYKKQSEILFGKLVYTDSLNIENTLYYGSLNSHFLSLGESKKTEIISTMEAFHYLDDGSLKVQWNKAPPEPISNEFELVHKKAYAKGLKFDQLLREARDE